MGSSVSVNKTKQASHELQKSEKDIVKLMMPVYYNPDPITREERGLAFKIWNLVLDNQAPEYLRLKGLPDFHYNSSVTFFYDSFYTRLFDIHPMSRQLFKGGMRSQGKFLVKMISLALSELDDPAKFDRNLVKLAEIHYERGVKAVEYGVVGEILFWCLRHVLGLETYQQSVHWIWVKVYSRMLTTIVPVAIALELKGGSEHSRCRDNSRSSFIFTTSNYSQQAEEAVQAAEGSAPAGSMDEEDDNDSLVSERIRIAEPTQSAKSVARCANDVVDS
eukprot:scaffold1882_cov163-Ochromonas_danica.AAC.12